VSHFPTPEVLEGYQRELMARAVARGDVAEEFATKGIAKGNELVQHVGQSVRQLWFRHPDVVIFQQLDAALKQAHAEGLVHENDPIFHLTELMVQYGEATTISDRDDLRTEILTYLNEGAKIYAENSDRSSLPCANS